MKNNMDDPQITIFLTTPEAIMFRDFQRYHKIFTLFLSKGVFDVKNGEVTIHFDPTGQISAIVRSDRLFDIHAP